MVRSQMCDMCVTQGWFQIRFTAPPRMYFSPVGRKQQSDATVQHVMCGECKVDEGDTQRHRKMVDAISAVARETQTKKRKTRQKKGRDGGQAGRQQGSGGGDGGASACSDKKHRRAGEARAREQGSVDRDRKELGRGSEEDDSEGHASPGSTAGRAGSQENGDSSSSGGTTAATCGGGRAGSVAEGRGAGGGKEAGGEGRRTTSASRSTCSPSALAQNT